MPVDAAPAAMSSGLDKAGMDTGVRPQDSLFFAMNGTWLKNTPIPADKSDYGTFTQLDDLSNERVKAIIEGLAAKPQPMGTVGAKVGDFYTSYMDTAAIDAAGLRPLWPYLAQIDAVRTRKDLVTLMGAWVPFVDLPMGLGVGPDARDPTVYSAGAAQGGLGLGDRDYYLKKDERFAKARKAYVDYIRTLLAAQGSKNATIQAAAVMNLETRLARVQWTKEANRDPVKTYNPMTTAQLAAKAPDVDWKAWLAAGELSDPPFVSVAQPSYFWALDKLIKSEPLDVWKAYLRVHLIDAVSLELPANVRDARFQFHGVAMTGVKTDRARWERAVGTLNDSMGEAIGQVYVSEYFPPAYKARMVELVDNLMKAYAQSIDGLTWMSPATKVEAHAKLAKYGIKIGYPDHWRDYTALDVKAGDALGNTVRAATFEYHRQVVRNTKPVDRTEWGMTPQTVNAYYDGTKNEIVFPAAILQPPFFDMKADDATNYGAIGAVIGHEISHGFDDEGSQYDGDGKLRNWWTPEDRKAFEAITGKLDAQYSAYEPLPGVHVKGKLTMGENIADLSGLQIAYKAWKISLNGKPAPVIDGLTGEQRFYYGFSQAWREKLRDEAMLHQVTSDPHSPPQFRADGASINSDGFHEAFDTKPGDKMWKAPADRIRLW
ncbi:M13 family metallopeptidase [Comamonadaceae bacterium BS-T2-15]|uniref:M13 family metallopeptidase n=2 Tax=Scleromatobacter humisilvae TaxID=2897159 RepID=A0A9X2C2R6_9BURK|nr:M13 family metallopeptidase [Scleromatobacter humisilvae]MCK9689056.1 M13 family metallopeptidase [Scleromatobacter humisilvae]